VENVLSQENFENLQEALDLKQRELDLILAIDHIRDTAPDPIAMLSAIVQALCEHLRVELCLISLVDRETGQIELKAITDRRPEQSQLEQVITRPLVGKAVQLDHVTIWDRDSLGISAKVAGQLPETFQLAAVPIIMGKDERLGAILLGRTECCFSSNDIKLLKTAESMIDSAVIQGYADYELRQHVKELETIYRIDHIRDQNLAFDDLLNVVLQEVCKVIAGEVGFTLLYDQAGKKLELRASTDSDLFKISDHYELIHQVANEALHKTRLVYNNDLGERLRSLMCLPLILNDEIIGVLGVANQQNGRGFSSEDRRLLQAIGSQIDTAIFESLERRRLRQVLGRSVDPRVMERLLANRNTEFLKGERAILSVLYADLRGSTNLAEQTDPELLVGFINHYLAQMTEIILANEGTLDKFVGDEVMALFGAPFPQADHALRAVRVGLEMQRAHQQVMDMWRDRAIEPAPIGVGIATGELIAGEMGSPQRSDYTVIGKAANLGARICSAASAGEVLVSEQTYELIRDAVEAEPVTGLHFKGISRDVTVYRINRIIE
jgi:class 3 adenylate cyclase